MTIYEVIVEVELELAHEFELYMTQKHIPEIFATGCFSAARFDRASDTRFRTRYEAATSDDLDRYLTRHAAHFRADFHAHFPVGAVPSREVWTAVKAWG